MTEAAAGGSEHAVQGKGLAQASPARPGTCSPLAGRRRDCEWACFAAQQAAEKALKALYQKAGAEAWGHSVFALLESLPEPFAADQALEESGKELDKHYIPARCPNSYPQGSPHEYYTRSEAERAAAQAERVLRFCESHLS
jgi:HEPN domain-containing protein